MVRLFVGIGSPHGDDVAGWAIADQLAQDPNLPSDVLVRRALVPLDLLDWLEGIESLYVCDACRIGAPAGTLHHWKFGPDHNGSMSGAPWPNHPSACLRSSGSHAWGLASVFALAQKLERLPAKIELWGIEGRSFNGGDSPALELLANIAQAAAEIRESIGRPQVSVELPNSGDLDFFVGLPIKRT